jgi:lysophospholipase-1
MLLSDRIKNYMPEEWANKKTPFFLAHGVEDNVVPFASGKISAAKLKELGLEIRSLNSM